MRLLIQRVKEAEVKVEGSRVAGIAQGLLIFLGIHRNDKSEQIPWLVEKTASLRCFSDAAGKMNLNVTEVDGSVLIVSQFTLYGNCQKGRRPDFLEAAPPDIALPLYEEFVFLMRKKITHLSTGQFGADMEVMLTNDGPVTFLIDR